MKFIITALHVEARPLIQHFGLKKDPASKRLSVYRKDDLCLAVSGTGKVKSATATAWLLGRYGVDEGSIMLNFGFCGATDPAMATGELLVINKITDAATGRSFYPEMLLKAGLPERMVVTYDAMVTQENAPDAGDAVVDMEASGFFQAAVGFLPVSRILCLKLVSDHLEGKHLHKEKMSALIESKLPQLEAIIERCGELIQKKKDFSAEEKKQLDTLAENLRLSATQQHQLRDCARSYLIRHHKGLKVLQPYMDVMTRNKTERNRVLENIKHALT